MTNPAIKATKMRQALIALSSEYEGRPDVQTPIADFLKSVGPAQLSLLYELVMYYETSNEAAEFLAGENDAR